VQAKNNWTMDITCQPVGVCCKRMPASLHMLSDRTLCWEIPKQSYPSYDSAVAVIAGA